MIKEAMEQGTNEGCQTFDQALFALYKDDRITLDQALMNSDSANNLRLKIKLEGLSDEDPAPGGKSQGGLNIAGMRPSGSHFRRI
jgi:Tfp pilus assembly ATPase PilU